MRLVCEMTCWANGIGSGASAEIEPRFNSGYSFGNVPQKFEVSLRGKPKEGSCKGSHKLKNKITRFPTHTNHDTAN